MQKSKIRFLSILHRTPPFKDICFKTQIERDRERYDGNNILYLDIKSINREDKLEVQNYLN